jgi:hypothetical protein
MNPLGSDLSLKGSSFSDKASRRESKTDQGQDKAIVLPGTRQDLLRVGTDANTTGEGIGRWMTRLHDSKLGNKE